MPRWRHTINGTLARREAEYPFRLRRVKCHSEACFMRLSLIFLMLILLPVATAVHAWLFYGTNRGHMTEEALRRLKQAGVHDPVVDIRFYDIAISGEAEDPAAAAKAVQAVRTLGPLRLRPEATRLHVTARLKATLAGEELRISGWLPEGDEAENVRKIVADLRPDLQVHTQDLRVAPEVSWPEGFKPPLTANSPLLKPILEKLRVPAELQVTATEDAIVLTGLLSDPVVKEEAVAALAEVAEARVVDPAELKASSHVTAAAFVKQEALAAFLRSFFALPPPRSFRIGTDGIPHLEGMATRQAEGEWLALLRPVTGGAKVEAQLTLAPSLLHFPGYQTQSVLPSEALAEVRTALQQICVEFEVGAIRLSPDEQTKLAALTPLLLAAGPSLGLVIGAHPDPAGRPEAEKSVGRMRAEAVLSFLIEQGVPSADISAVVFDAVPPGSTYAPAIPRCVEILVK